MSLVRILCSPHPSVIFNSLSKFPSELALHCWKRLLPSVNAHNQNQNLFCYSSVLCDSFCFIFFVLFPLPYFTWNPPILALYTHHQPLILRHFSLSLSRAHTLSHCPIGSERAKLNALTLTPSPTNSMCDLVKSGHVSQIWALLV